MQINPDKGKMKIKHPSQYNLFKKMLCFAVSLTIILSTVPSFGYSNLRAIRYIEAGASGEEPTKYVLRKRDAIEVSLSTGTSLKYLEPAEEVSFEEALDHLARYPSDKFMFAHFEEKFYADISPEQVAEIIQRFRRRPLTVWLFMLTNLAILRNNPTAVGFLTTFADAATALKLCIEEQTYSNRIRLFWNPNVNDYLAVQRILRENRMRHVSPGPEDIACMRRYGQARGFRDMRAPFNVSALIFWPGRGIKDEDTGMSLRHLTADDTWRNLEALHFGEEVLGVTSCELMNTDVKPPYNCTVNWTLKLNSSVGENNFQVEREEASFGKGRTEQLSQLSGFFEAFERASATVGCGESWPSCHVHNMKLRKASYNELVAEGHRDILEPNQLNISMEYNPDDQLYWVEGVICTAGGNYTALIPAQIVFLLSNFDETLLKTPKSNGLSSGNSLMEARRQALLELIERMGIYANFFTPSRCFTLDTITPSERELAPDICKILDDVKRHFGVKIQFLDLSTGLDVPVYKAFVQVNGMVIAGSRADLDPLNAIRGALGEVVAKLSIYEKRFGVSIRDSDITVPGGTVKKFTELTALNRSAGNVISDVKFIEELLRLNGYSVYYVTLTRKDLKIPVVRVIVPGLDIPENLTARQYWNFLETFAPQELTPGPETAPAYLQAVFSSS